MRKEQRFCFSGQFLIRYFEKNQQDLTNQELLNRGFIGRKSFEIGNVLLFLYLMKSLCMQVEEEMVPKGLQSTIRLKGTAQRQDSARFQCLARNDFGSNKTDINFVVQVHINNLFLEMRFPQGAFNNYVDKMRGGGGLKMSVFVHAQGTSMYCMNCQ